jgi:glycosyltransferase 2 family protein
MTETNVASQGESVSPAGVDSVNGVTDVQLRRESRRRGRVFAALRVCVSAAALGYVLHRSGVRNIAHSLATATPAWLVFGFALGLLSALVTALQWHGLIRANGMARRYRRVLHLELAGRVFDAALPGSIGGDVVRAFYVGDSRAERLPGATSVVLRRLCNFPGMVVLMVVGFGWSSGLPYISRIRPYSLAAIVGGTVFVLAAVTPVFGWAASLRLFRRGIGNKIAKLLTALHEFRGRRRDLFLASVRGVVFWCVVVVSQWGFMRAVGVHVPFGYAMLVVTTTNAITMVPISLGGYGLREGAFAAFLAVHHLATPAQGVAVGVCLTAQTVGLGIAGLPFYLTIRRAARRRTDAAVSIVSPAVS